MADKDKTETQRVKDEQEALDAGEESRDALLGDLVELEFTEACVLPSGDRVEAGEVGELPKVQAIQAVRAGRAKFNTVDISTGKKKASTGKGRRKKK